MIVLCNRDIECSKSIELVSPSFSLTTTYIVNSVYLVYHQDTTYTSLNENFSGDSIILATVLPLVRTD